MRNRVYSSTSLSTLVTVLVVGGVACDGATFEGYALAGQVGHREERLSALAPNIWDQRSLSVCWEDAGFASEKAWVETVVRATWERESQLVFTWSQCAAGRAANIRIHWTDVGPYTVGLGSALNNVRNGMVLNPTFNRWGRDCRGQEQRCIEAIAVHEFGHALGFAHEQNRADTPDTCTEAPQGTTGDTPIGAWDSFSVLNYCNPTWNNAGALSRGDVVGLQQFYGLPKRRDFVSRVLVGSGRWGSWTPVHVCEPGSWVSSYAMRVEGRQRGGDDTALNAVQFECRTRNGALMSVLRPHPGYWGSWGSFAACPTGSMLRGASMRIEGRQRGGDDTGANSVRGQCTGGSPIEAAGGRGWGSWNSLQLCPRGTAVCGVSVRVEGRQGSGDDTAMNGMQVDCCTF